MGGADGGGGQVKGWSMLHAHEGECPISWQGKPLTQGLWRNSACTSMIFGDWRSTGSPHRVRLEQKAVCSFSVKWEEHEIYDQ